MRRYWPNNFGRSCPLRGQEHRFGRSDRMSAFLQDAYTSVTIGALEKFWIIKLAATTLGGTGGCFRHDTLDRGYLTPAR